MNRLWCATSMLAQDPAFRDQVKEVAATHIDDTITDPIKQEQPEPDSLAKIDSLFREKGVYLSLYALAELNRWMVIDKNGDGDTSSYLDRFWQSIQPIYDITPDELKTVLLEAVGLLLVDPDVRHKFVAGELNLTDRGYELTPEIEDALRKAVASEDAEDAANEWLDDSWPGVECFSRLDFYSTYIHPNQ